MKTKILIVEDDRPLGTVLEKHLERDDRAITVIQNGLEGEMAPEHPLALLRQAYGI